MSRVGLVIVRTLRTQMCKRQVRVSTLRLHLNRNFYDILSRCRLDPSVNGSILLGFEHLHHLFGCDDPAQRICSGFHIHSHPQGFPYPLGNETILNSVRSHCCDELERIKITQSQHLPMFKIQQHHDEVIIDTGDLFRNRKKKKTLSMFCTCVRAHVSVSSVQFKDISERYSCCVCKRI